MKINYLKQGRIYILVAVVILISGCTYTGHLEKGFHTPDSQIRSKVDLSVGLVNTKEIQEYRIQEQTGNRELTFYINPAFNEELTKELSNIFSIAQIVSTPLELSKFDLQVVPKLSYKYIEGTAWTGRYKYELTIALTFVDVKSNSVIEGLSYTSDVLISPPPSATFLSFLTGLSLMILSPITLPLAMQLGGDNAKGIIEETVSRSFGILSWKVANSQKIKDYVKSKKAPNTIFNDQSINMTIPKNVAPPNYEDQKYKNIRGIVLYNGDVIGGQIIRLNAQTVMIRTKDGNVSSYSVEREVKSFIKD
jgi:hypothetical protein